MSTFAVSISWTVVSRLADCHHLFAALFAKAHLVMIRQYMIMRFILVLWFFLLGGFFVVEMMGRSPQPELPQHWSSLRCTLLCRHPLSPPLAK